MIPEFDNTKTSYTSISSENITNPLQSKYKKIWDLLNDAVSAQDKAAENLYDQLAVELETSSESDFKLDDDAFNHLHQLLQRNSNLKEKQFSLALALSKYFSNCSDLIIPSDKSSLEKGLEFCKTGTQHVAKAIQIAENLNDNTLIQKAHLICSNLILKAVAHLFSYRLVDFKKSAEPVKFNSFLFHVERLFGFCSTQEQAELFLTAIDSAIKGKANDPEYKESFVNLNKWKTDVRENRCIYRTQLISLDYWNALKKFRSFFHAQEFPLKNIKDFQAQAFNQFKALVNFLFQEALLMMGDAPCGFDMRALGSAAREEVCPFSDLEFMFLIENEKHKSFFKTLIQLFSIQVCCLGESTDNFPLVYSSIHGKSNPSGFHLDGGGNPALESSLLGTPKEIALLQKTKNIEKPNTAQSTTLKSSSLCSTSSQLFEDYISEVNLLFSNEERQNRMYKFIQNNFESDFKEVSENVEKLHPSTFDLKNSYFKAYFHLIGYLGLYFNIRATNTQDIIQELVQLGIFNSSTGFFLQKAALKLYELRVKLHLYYCQQDDTIALSNHQDLQLFRLNQEQMDELRRIYWLAIRPLNLTLRKIFKENSSDLKFNIKNLDLLKVTLIDLCEQAQLHSKYSFLETIVADIAMTLIEAQALDNKHIEFYTLLADTNPKNDSLRSIYLKNLKHHRIVEFLATIPDSKGMRQAYLEKMDDLSKAIKAMTVSEQPPSPITVKVTACDWEKPYYLRPDVIDTIIDAKTGQLQNKQHHPITYQSGSLSLAFEKQSKQHLMNFSINNLLSRIGGIDLSPSSDVVQFDVNIGNKKISYLVTITESMPGTTLSEFKTLDWKNNAKEQWTWMFLITLLLKPGNGQASQYTIGPKQTISFLNDGYVFAEPLVKMSDNAKKIGFRSALFCFFPDVLLETSVLKTFCQLKPKRILNAWLEDVIRKDEQCRKLQSNSGDQCHSSFQEGTITTLMLQFYRLRRWIEESLNNGVQIKVLDLLSELISLNMGDSTIELVGPKIHNSYKDLLNLPLSERFDKLILEIVEEKSKSRSNSSTSLGDKFKNLFSPPPTEPNLNRPIQIPTLDQIANRKSLSLVEAKNELVAFKAKMIIDFKGLSIPQQKALVQSRLNSIQLAGKPLSLSLLHCDILDIETLTKFLHKNLKFLDLSYSSKVNASYLALIQNTCSEIGEIHLTGCKDLDNIAMVSGLFLKDYHHLNFPKLKVLVANDCQKLKTIVLSAPIIKTISAKNNPSLETIQLQEETKLDELTKLKKEPNHVRLAKVDVSNCPKLDESTKVKYVKESVIKALKEDWTKIKSLYNGFDEDPDVILRALEQTSEAFFYVAEELKDDEKFFLLHLKREADYVRVIRQGGRMTYWPTSHSFQFASKRLREIPEVIIAAATLYADALMHVTPEKLSDKSLMLPIVSKNGDALRHVSPFLKDDDELVKIAVKEDGKLIRFASKRLQNDYEIVKLAYQQNPESLKYTSPFLAKLIKEGINKFDIRDFINAPVEVKNDSDLILKLIKYDGKVLIHSSDSVKDKDQVVELAVQYDGLLLQYASPRLKNNKLIVLSAIGNNPFAIQFVSEELKDDKDVVLKAVKLKGETLEYASESLKNDPEIVLAAVTQNGIALPHAHERFKNNREVVLIAVRTCGSMLLHADDSFRNDREVVLAAVQNDGTMLEHVNERFRKDPEVVLAAVKQNHNMIKFADKSLMNNREIAVAVVQKDGRMLQYFDDDIKGDAEIVLIAVKQTHEAFQFSKNLSKNREINFEVVKQNGYMFQFIDDSFKNDPEIALTAIKQVPYMLQYAHENIRNNKSIVSVAVKITGSSLQFASKILLNDQEIVQAAFMQEDKSIQYASVNLRSNPIFMLEFLKISEIVIEYVTESVWEDFDFALFAFKKQEGVIRKISDRLKDNQKFMMEITNINKTAIQYASPYLKDNFDFMMTMLKKNKDAIIECSTNLKSNKDFMIQAIKLHFSAFKYATPLLKGHAEFMLAAIHIDMSVIKEASIELRSNKDFMIKAITLNYSAFQYTAENLFSNAEYMLVALQKNKEAIKKASPNLTSDKDFMTKAIKLDFFAFDYISDKLKDNSEFIFFANQLNKKAIKSASRRLKNDSVFMLTILRSNKEAIKEASADLRSNLNFMTQAIKIDFFAFDFASNDLKDHFDFMLFAISQNKIAIKSASIRLKENLEFMMRAIQIDFSTFEYASDPLKDNPYFMLLAVKLSKDAIKEASSNLKSNKSFMMQAIDIRFASIEHASVVLKEDFEFMVSMLRKDKTAIKFASIKLRNNSDFMLTATKINKDHYVYASKELKGNSNFMLAIIRLNKDAIKDLEYNLTNSQEFMLAAIKINKDAIHYVPMSLRGAAEMSSSFGGSEDFMLEVLKIDVSLIKHCNWIKLHNNRDFLLKCVKINGLALQYGSDGNKRDLEICRAAVAQNPQAIKFVSEEIRNTL